MEKYCTLCQSRLMELDLDANKEHHDDVPLEIGEERVAIQNNIFTLSLIMVYQVCSEFDEFFYKMQIFSIKCCKSNFLYIILNLISAIH